MRIKGPRDAFEDMVSVCFRDVVFATYLEFVDLERSVDEPWEELLRMRLYLPESMSGRSER